MHCWAYADISITEGATQMFRLFIEYIKIGLFSVGGGYAMLPLIYQTVHEFGAMGKSEFSDMVAISQITPGPIAVNIATYTGFDLYGWSGALLMSLAVCLPCFVFSLVLAGILRRNQGTLCLDMMIGKMKICGIALIAVSGIFIADGSIVELAGSAGNALPSVDIFQLALFIVSILVYRRKWIGPVALTFIMGMLSLAGEWLIDMMTG